MDVSPGFDRTSILVVDDQPINRALLAAVLEAEGYQVHVADGAEQALALLEHVRPRVVLTDLQMPGVNGIALAGQLRAHPATREALIVAITAYPSEHAEDTAREAGCDDYIEKPIDVSLLPTRLAASLSPPGRRAVQPRLSEACRELIEALPAIVSLSAPGPSDDLPYVNGQIEAVLGFSAAACIADRDILLRQVHPEDQERVVAALAARVRAERSAGFDYRMRTRDGRDVWVHDVSHTLYDEAGNPRAWMRVIFDVSSQRQAEAALVGAQRKLEHLLAASPGVVFSLDPTTYRPTYVSEGARSVLGCSARDLLAPGDLWRERFHPDDLPLVDEALARVLTQGAVRYQYRFRQREGEYRWLQDDLRLVCDALGRPSEIAGVSVDVTAQKQVEAERETAAGAEKMRQLGLLASGTAHDLNQALALVVGHAELGLRHLESGGAAPDLLRELFQTILDAAGDGGETVRALLKFGRETPDEPVEAVDLATVLRETAQFTTPRWRDASQAEGRPIRLEVAAEPGLAVRARPGELREALTNLIFNAVDALPTGGTIHLQAARADQRVVVEVVDTGVGMTPEVRARAFEPFFTTKGIHGTGLGLANVREIARRIGGEAEVDSAPGVGTTLRLMLHPAPIAAARLAPVETTERAGSALRVLVVDDEARLARMATRVLDAAGHITATAASGEEALSRLAAEPFDVLVTDLAMGDGINGYTLAATAHARWPALGIVLASGWGASIEPSEAERLGIDAVLAKPYRAGELCRVVEGVATGQPSFGRGVAASNREERKAS